MVLIKKCWSALWIWYCLDWSWEACWRLLLCYHQVSSKKRLEKLRSVAALHGQVAESTSSSAFAAALWSVPAGRERTRFGGDPEGPSWPIVNHSSNMYDANTMIGKEHSAPVSWIMLGDDCILLRICSTGLVYLKLGGTWCKMKTCFRLQRISLERWTEQWRFLWHGRTV